MNKYANALERFNRKWGLKYMRQASDDLLSWGSAAWQEEMEVFQPQAGRGQMLVDRIQREKPDILMMQELDHYRFFQDALAKLPGLPYSSSKEDGLKYHYRTDFLAGLPEATNPKWGKQFTQMEGGRFNVPLQTAKENEVEYQTQFLAGKMSNFAYLPKRLSNAQAFHPNKIGKKDVLTRHNDNDGVAIFWNTDRFKAEKIEKVIYPVRLDDETIVSKPKRVFPGKEGGVCAVLLRDQKDTSKLVWALTTHVPSGAKLENEEERKSMVKAASETIQKWP